MNSIRRRAAGALVLLGSIALIGLLVFGGAGSPSAIAQTQTSGNVAGGADPLPNAKPGECYARLFIPPQYKTVTEEVTVRDAAQKIEVVPAKYQMVDERVLVKAASHKLVNEPAVYETVKERVEIEPARRIWRTSKAKGAKQASPQRISAALALGVPATAKPGECYAEYLIPAQFKTEKQKVLIKEATQKIELVPAKYEWTEQKVTVKEASHRLVPEAAKYETVTEKVLEAPAYTTWKKGRGLVERIDHSSGEIMCRVEVPAKYKTVKKRVLKAPAKINKVEIPAEQVTMKVRKMVTPPQEKKVEIPAQYNEVSKRMQVAEAKIVWRAQGSQGPGEPTGRTMCLTEQAAKFNTVNKRVVKTPPKTRKVEIPAEYKTVKVRKLASPAKENRVAIPARTEKVTRREQVSAGRVEWRQVLCETNTSPDLVLRLQQALKTAGYNPGPIDGVIGSQTMAALASFQERKGLPRGGLTMATLQALGVKLAN